MNVIKKEEKHYTMKTLNIFVIVLGSILATFTTFGQSGFILSGLSTVTPTVQSCDQNVSISIGALSNNSTNSDYNLVLNGSNFSPSQFTMIINWGDGSVTTHNGTTSSIGTSITWTPSLYHYYNTPGSYVISIQLTNPQNNSSVSTNLYYLHNSCSWISAYIQVDCNNDGVLENTFLNNVPINFTGPNGYSSQFNSTNGGAWTQVTTNGTYTASIDPNWLTTNNYVLSSSSNTQLNVTGPNDSDTAYLILNCANATNTLCVSGTLFCDANMNGIQDSGEDVIAYAPLNITNNGNNYIVYTNASGQYSLTYPGAVSSPTVISLNGLWMSQNNYTSQSMVFTTLGTPCGTPSIVNIPLICAVSNPSLCAAALVFCDANGNNIMDSGENPLQNAPVTFYNGNNPAITAYTDSVGWVMVCGNYFNMNLITAQINPNWLIQHGYTVTNSMLTLQAINATTPSPGMFAVNCGGTTSNVCDDLWTTVTPWIGYFQGTTATIRLNFGNYGPGTATTYSLSLSYPVGVTPVVSSISIPGYTISGNTISWNLTNAAAGYSFTDYIQFTLPSGLINGAQHYFTSNITATGSNTDCNYANNDGSLLQILGNSYDPNDKTVHQAEQMSPVITDNLTYTIRFQNTGTAPAQNVHILDTLSTNLDWSTFDLIYASHYMNVVDLGNGVRKFDFPQIWLPDSTSNEPESHGIIVYRIKELVTNGEGEEIFNTAHIYFDWNPAIVTNTTYNVNTSLGIEELGNSSVIYPNPTSNNFTIKANERIEQIRIYDMLGKEWKNLRPTSSNPTVDISALPEGIYLVNMSTEKGTFTERLIKQ
jgi:uncharacterized repeat protein (TIGR01451 family)